MQEVNLKIEGVIVEKRHMFERTEPAIAAASLLSTDTFRITHSQSVVEESL